MALYRLVLILVFAAALWTPALGQDPPRILTVDEQVERCRAFAGDARDECLVNLVFREEDPKLCALAPESRCAAIVGSLLMERCARFPEERAFCEIAVAQQTAAVEACEAAADRTNCVAAVADARADPSVIVDHLDDPLARDLALATYGSIHGDPAAIALIEDDRTHDLAVAAIIPAIAIGRGERVDPSFCDRLRGGYKASYYESGAESARKLCAASVGMSNYIATLRDTAETEAETDAVISMIAELSAALERGDIDLGDMATLGGGATTGCDAIPGVWSWFVNGNVTFHPDGTHEQGTITGTWSCSGGTVRLSWSHGYEDEMTLSDDGTRLEGTGRPRDAPADAQGFPVSGTKIR